MGDGRTSQELGRMKTLPHIRAASRAVEPNEEPIKRPPASQHRRERLSILLTPSVSVGESEVN